MLKFDSGILDVDSFEEEVKTMRAKMDAMTDVYDTLQDRRTFFN